MPDLTDSISLTQAAARTAAIDAIARLEYGGWSQAYDSIRDPEIDAPPPPYDEAADHPMRLTYERVGARIVDATGDALNQLVAALLPSKAQLIAERDAALARVAELEAAQAKVRAHIEQRPEYIDAIQGGGSEDDVWRWRGGAEARRQLAEALGWTVPYQHGEKAEPKEAGRG